MRVLQVIASLAASEGGPSTVLRSLEAALSQAGAHVTTVTTDHGSDIGVMGAWSRSTVTRSGGCVTRRYFCKRVDFYKVAPGAWPWLLRNVAGYDVVHVHGLFTFMANAGALAAHIRGVPFLVRPFGTLSPYGLENRRPLAKRACLKLLDGPLLRRASAIHFTSEQEKCEAALCGITGRGTVIPPGVDLGPRPPNSNVRGTRRLSILFLSRLDPKKNVVGLLCGFARLAETHDVRLIIAGAGSTDHEACLRSKARALGLGELVQWEGHVDPARRRDLLRSADIFVLPSLSENFGMAVVEALAAGLPAVVGKGVAIAGAVERAGAGLAVDRTATEIHDGLLRLVCDPQLRRAMGKRARALAERDYSSDLMTARVLDLYRDVMRDRRARLRSQ